MPQFEITAWEKLLVKTRYVIEAPSQRAAVQRVRSGEEAYEDHSIEEGDGEWIRVLDVRKLPKEK